MHAPTCSLLITLLAASLSQSGCHGPLNESNGLLGEESSLPALGPADPAPLQAQQPLGAVVPLNRSQWQREVITVDQGQVEAQPSYGSAEPVVGELGQPWMRWPTTTTALNTQLNPDGEALNALLAPAVAAGNIVVFPVRALITPPWSVVVVTPLPEDFQLLPEQQVATPWHWVQSPEEGPDDDEQ